MRFNPRAHVGRDNQRLVMPRKFRCFNPRAHVGRDTFRSKCRISSFLFQSTRPRGARRGIRQDRVARVFQSTRPRGARPAITLRKSLESLFQSTRPRGARRQWPPQTRRSGTCFNPRAHVGRDCQSLNSLQRQPYYGGFRLPQTLPRGIVSARRNRAEQTSSFQPLMTPRGSAGSDLSTLGTRGRSGRS